MSQKLYNKVFKKCSGTSDNSSCNHIASTLNEQSFGINFMKPYCLKGVRTCRS